MRISEEEKIFLMEIVEKLNDEIGEEFGTGSDDDLNPIEDLSYELSKEFSCEYANGATKSVLIFPDHPFVLKIPFNGMYYDSYDIDDEWVGTDFQYFELADDINEGNEWDYCKNELLKYNHAVEDGFGEFFAYTDYLTSTARAKHPIYIQERVIVYGDTVVTPSNNSMDLAKSDKYKKFSAPVGWKAMVIDFYGEIRALEFFEYIKNNRYSDLHSSNVGFTMAGAPVLLDWAGWRD